MQFWLCRSPEKLYGGKYVMINYCPYRARKTDKIQAHWLWYPRWLGGRQIAFHSIDREELEVMGTIPYGSVKNLVTGKILQYEELLTMDDYDDKKYYEWGIE